MMPRILTALTLSLALASATALAGGADVEPQFYQPDMSEQLVNALNNVEWQTRRLERRVERTPLEERKAWVRAANGLASERLPAAHLEQLERWVERWSAQIYPSLAGRFDREAAVDAARIYQHHDLIEHERINIGESTFAERESLHRLIVKEGAPNPDLAGTLGRSIERMRLGEAPIGRDGKPLELCRISRFENAAYLEMTSSEAHLLTRELAAFETLDSACLRGETQSRYWQSRRGDFVGPRGHHRRPD
ncbi:hypothetical protein J2T57_001284 [Natronocella acetinitrilica]|uniref:Uncharacterized protein n=1 Tax=Natronocella acetinitrilica TaxID=414046 RepID=A0AAE3KFL2_9GAMM|nr:HNH/ENDO VII family nuclease [Natronocella acetinitrilica]MCP1674182.1 hypothetical protein [Natronocella acetinitrilica]